MTYCAGCNELLPPGKPLGRPRKWCSEKCRKITLYSRKCLDCGITVNTDGSVTDAAKRCRPCASRVSGESRRHWTRDLIFSRFNEWSAVHGEPPAIADWNPTEARRYNDPVRASRFARADGYWPTVTTVVRMFGSWNAGVEAAGFSPRPAHGVSGRHRTQRERAAA